MEIFGLIGMGAVAFGIGWALHAVFDGVAQVLAEATK